MELTVTQENLAKALGNVGRVASLKAQLPILNNILLRTSGSQLLVAATNLEIASVQTIGAKVVKNGSITVPAKLIADFVHNLPKGTVSLKLKGTQLTVTSEGYSSTINGLSDEEFPELPIIDQKSAVVYAIASEEFKQAATQTIVTASTDATRPVLTGVYWHAFEQQLFLASTDGYRLSERQIMKVSTDIAAIVPVSTVQEVLRTMTDESDIEVLFDDSQVKFRIGDGEITSRLIDGNFPDYRQLIPATTDTQFTVDKADFLRIVKIASLFSRDTGGSITLKVDTGGNTLTINSIASEIGENTSEIAVQSSGLDASVSLNSRYLNDALSSISGNQVVFAFSGKLAPCVLSEAAKDSGYKHIIMPIKS